MKNTVDAAAFYKAMTALMEVPSKSSIEVLREIRAEFTGDRCVLSATDLDTWMSVTITAVGDSFDFLFRNSANIQKVCRHYDGALELELQQRLHIWQENMQQQYKEAKGYGNTGFFKNILSDNQLSDQ